MFLALSPIKSLFQIAWRRRTNRIFTTDVFNIVKSLLTSATLACKSHNETHSTPVNAKIHLQRGRSDQAANKFDQYH